MATTISGRMTEIILARFEPGEDLRQGLLQVIKDRDIKSGLVLSITGSLEKANLHHLHRQVGGKCIMESIEVPGPLEASGHGIIGQIEAPAFGTKPFGPGGEFVHGEPYLHVHLTVTSAEQTICGHIMDGATVLRIHPKHTKSHFTVVLGRIEGAGVSLFGEPDPLDELHPYVFGHELVRI